MTEEHYVFALPPGLEQGFKLLRFDESASMVENQPKKETTPPLHTEIKAKSVSGCQTCATSLSGINQNEKIKHYKTDLHRLNIKRSLNELPPLSEAEFEDLLEKQSLDSISGSESELDSEQEDHTSSLMEKLSVEPSQGEEHNVSHMNTNSPFLLLGLSHVEEGKAFGIYKALFSKKALAEAQILSELPTFSQPPVSSGKSVLLMIGGGHFAGAVISHQRKDTRGNVNHNESRQEQMVNVVVSKTFHRYTTRRKQGGSQSASDNARGKANSAGSSIRRYNELALQQEVRDLLNSWKEHLAGAQYVFIRANAAANKKTLAGYEGAPLLANDPRIRNFPFTTKRPTLSELKRAWVNLSYLHVVDLPKASKEQQRHEREKQQQEQQKKSQIGKESKTPEPLSASDNHTKELIALLKRSKAPLMINYLRKNKLDVNFRFTPASSHAHAPTPLHYAASQGLHHMVQILLVNLKADPTILNALGQTASQMSNPETKKVFQICRHTLGEDYTDWAAAKVGPPRSKEDVAQEEERAKKQQEKERQKLVEETLAQKTEMELKKPTFSSGGAFGGRVSQTAEVESLTDQQRTKLMREQRARAAEARLKMLQK